MAIKGTVDELHPPGNGTGHGVAFITPEGGGKKVIAHTPDDNNGEELTVGLECFYTMEANGRHIASISHTNPDGPADGGISG
ncbi:MAG: hypothetical protein JKX68_08685 [Flavobacteriales bacterium]|nr:hypothetical protein [Flavobacteriales bacterium]